MRVLVCGGRDFVYPSYLYGALDALDAVYNFTTVIHGAAPGADTLADGWAARRGKALKVYPAQWKTDGKSAGPKRNVYMLKDGQPELVVAFPGGFGTAHMMKIARAVSVRVIEIKKPD